MAFDRAIGAITLYCEASSEPPEAKLGVAWTFVNRRADGRFGASIAEVCLRRCQYSEWNGDRLDNENLLRAAKAKDTDSVMMECLSIYDEALSDAFSDPTCGATHYHDTSVDPPSWTVGAIETARLGKFVFYKGVK